MVFAFASTSSDRKKNYQLVLRAQSTLENTNDEQRSPKFSLSLSVIRRKRCFAPSCQNLFSLGILAALKSFQFLRLFKIPGSCFSLVWDELDGKTISNGRLV